MLFRVNICVYSDNHTKHTIKMFRFLTLKQVVHAVNTCFRFSRKSDITNHI